MSDENGRTPTWRWVAAGALTLVAALVTLLWTTHVSANETTETTVRQHGERLAAVDRWTGSVDARLERIERKLDELKAK